MSARWKLNSRDLASAARHAVIPLAGGAAVAGLQALQSGGGGLGGGENAARGPPGGGAARGDTVGGRCGGSRAAGAAERRVRSRAGEDRSRGLADRWPDPSVPAVDDDAARMT